MVGTALAKTDDKQLAVAKTGDIDEMFSEKELAVIKTSYAKGATDDEFFAFTKLCALRNLNPFAKEIYFVKRQTKSGPVVAHQVGIDGWRKMAASHKDWAGPGSIQCHGKTESGGFSHPVACTAIYKRVIRGEIMEIPATIEWDEFYPGPQLGFMWKTKPNLMLKKCAEAQAIRMAFPDMMSGISLPEEYYEQGDPIQLSEMDSEQKSEGVQALYDKPKTTKKKTKAKAKPKAIEAAPEPEIVEPEGLPWEEPAEEAPPLELEIPPAEEPEEVSGAARAMKAERMVKEMIAVSKGAFNRDHILKTFGKKSVAELGEPEFKRIEEWLTKNGG